MAAYLLSVRGGEVQVTKAGFYPALRHVARDRMESSVAETGRQCLCCTGYLEFRDPEGADFGVCLKRDSAHNGLVVFEHFGCSAHVYRKDQ